MRRRTWKAAVLNSALACAVVVAATTPLAQWSGWAEPGLVGYFARVLGFCISWVAIVLLLLTPVMFGAMKVPSLRNGRPLGAAASAVVAVLPFLLRLMFDGWRLFLLNMTEMIRDPVRLASDWLPFMIAGAVFGWFFAGQDKRSIVLDVS